MSTITHDTDETTLPRGETHLEAVEDSIHLPLDKVLAAVADTKQGLQQDISAVSVGLGLLWAEHLKLAEKVTRMEDAVGEITKARLSLHAAWVISERKGA
ncbi:hypothetical protein NDU88_005317 [Pleurodeles waltl]|uniref:Uncharacterized protein n=1 Tax=Pleurodeles waltl TaxID=8319 RepID=A0AAV7PHQ6_PLEWA|nr:hypothetical protein NDU88_005317 [Pleurodeles waltl]